MDLQGALEVGVISVVAEIAKVAVVVGSSGCRRGRRRELDHGRLGQRPRREAASDRHKPPHAGIRIVQEARHQRVELRDRDVKLPLEGLEEGLLEDQEFTGREVHIELLESAPQMRWTQNFSANVIDVTQSKRHDDGRMRIWPDFTARMR